MEAGVIQAEAGSRAPHAARRHIRPERVSMVTGNVTIKTGCLTLISTRIFPEALWEM